jgi:DedD protein
MSDEGLHEIQLNGKQLVFLFMTATVVAVVIFLCGVMVGRGVPAQRGVPVLAADGSDPTTSDEASTTASATDTAATSTAASSPSASPSSKLGLTYPNRLEEPEPVAEDVPAGLPAHEPFATTAVAKVPPPSPAPKSEAKPAAATAAVATTAKAKEPATPDATPAGPGYVVQVAAVRQRAEADTIRGRLTRKGYPAFVATAGTPGAPTYRVRVGKYPSRREADTVAAKLEREEQFKPWVTR